jgi:hypothetical protein
MEILEDVDFFVRGDWEARDLLNLDDKWGVQTHAASMIVNIYPVFACTTPCTTQVPCLH